MKAALWCQNLYMHHSIQWSWNWRNKKNNAVETHIKSCLQSTVELTEKFWSKYVEPFFDETATIAEERQRLGVFLVFPPSTDCQKEAGTHQEQAFHQEGQETDQEIFIERLPPTEAHCGWERGK